MGKEGTVVSLVTPQEERKLLQFAKKLGIVFTKQEMFKRIICRNETESTKEKETSIYWEEKA